jgi:hypothetical protein
LMFCLRQRLLISRGDLWDRFGRLAVSHFRLRQACLNTGVTARAALIPSEPPSGGGALQLQPIPTASQRHMQDMI